MQVSVEATEGLERKMTIAVPNERIEADVDSRLREAAKTVRINGFRQGKVPFNVVKNTRQTYDKFHQELITEVQVQFDDERPSWIPLETLIAIQNKKSLTI